MAGRLLHGRELSRRIRTTIPKMSAKLLGMSSQLIEIEMKFGNEDPFPIVLLIRCDRPSKTSYAAIAYCSALEIDVVSLGV